MVRGQRRDLEEAGKDFVVLFASDTLRTKLPATVLTDEHILAVIAAPLLAIDTSEIRYERLDASSEFRGSLS
jgi:hypothetical protein